MRAPLDNPFHQFSQWFDKAIHAGIDKPNAMVLSTSARDGTISSRIVLLSSFSEDGFVFHTNYLSEKGRELEQNHHASLLFWWDSLGYQVRISGTTEKTTPAASDEYFAGRPRGSQIGAWASEQSQVIEARSVLDQRVAEFTKKFVGAEVPRPPHWGGYIVKPVTFEFWINRDDRLHDRFHFDKQDDRWAWIRLAP